MTGAHAIRNAVAIIDHDCVIVNYIHLSRGISARCRLVGKAALLGPGTIVSNPVNICGGCTVGAGLAVVKNIAWTYVGVPARRGI